jgi:hypothetical protein
MAAPLVVVPALAVHEGALGPGPVLALGPGPLHGLERALWLALGPGQMATRCATVAPWLVSAAASASEAVMRSYLLS